MRRSMVVMLAVFGVIAGGVHGRDRERGDAVADRHEPGRVARAGHDLDVGPVRGSGVREGGAGLRHVPRGSTRGSPSTSATGIGENDDKVLAAIRAGNPPDAVMSWSLDSVGQVLRVGGLAGPHAVHRAVGDGHEPCSPTRSRATRATAGSQCALPFLTDAMGLYYNKDLFAKHGITEPPKTMSELTETAKKLTEFNPDGSIKVAGFVPWFGYYEFTPLELSIIFGADYYNEDGTASARRDRPGLGRRCSSGRRTSSTSTARTTSRSSWPAQGDEWSAPNDFQRGRVAMMFDGEWRVAMIEDYAPNLNYGDGPVPDPGRPGGPVRDRPGRRDDHRHPAGLGAPAEAWLLVQYLATRHGRARRDGQRDPQRADDLPGARVAGPRRHAAVPDVPGHLRRPRDRTTSRPARSGRRTRTSSRTSAADWQAGDVSDLQAGLERARAADRRRARGREHRDGAERVTAPIATTLTSTAARRSYPRRRPARRRALPALRRRRAVHVAVDHRVRRVHRLPDVREPVLQLHQLRPALARRS